MDKDICNFTPVELIIVYDANDIPDQHYDLLLNWLKKKHNYKGDLISDVWDMGFELKIIHWEWRVDGDYQIVVDISGNADDQESGIVCVKDNIIFENNKGKLKVLSKVSDLHTKLKPFEHLRQIGCTSHKHCKYISELYQELKEDLKEESVDEEEIREYIEHYQHCSEDDCSSVSYETDDSDSDSSESESD